jgi:TRAP-type C4-dicarboxylate transport system permease small subunit
LNAARQTVATKTMVKLATILAGVVYPLSRWFSYISMVACAGMMLVIAADVFMRRVFNAPIFGAYDVIKVLLVLIVFCAVAYVMMAKEHVLVDTLIRLYPGKLKRAVGTISCLLNMLILALICWQSLLYGISMLRAGEKLVLLQIPVSPFIFMVSFGYAVFFLVVLVQFIFTLAGVAEYTGQPIPSGEAPHG